MDYSIFISYRRRDSRTATSLLYNSLTADRFGRNDVFVDTGSIESGDKWDEMIGKSLQNAKIVLAIIGKKWVGKNNGKESRIFNKDDWVRKEIGMALALKKTIVPILIDGAKMPDETDVPESIRTLCRLNAREMIFSAGNNDGIQALISFLNYKLRSINAPDELADSLINVLANKYEIEKTIGMGSRAKVYLGRDTGLDRKVAIKAIISKEFNSDFLSTLKDAARINDLIPNSISILGAYVKKDPFHVIMTYLNRGSLRKLVTASDGRPLPYKDIKNILLTIGRVLIKLHNNKLAHCNVMPSNVILNEDLEPYLNSLSRNTEFTAEGIIKKLSATSKVHDTSPEHKEELCYLAPEIFDKKAGSDSLVKRNEKIDQFMLGLMAYELLTGQIPQTVSGLSDLKIKGAEAFRDLPNLTKLRNDCPDRFAKIIHKMIDYDPRKRYSSLEDAIQEIDEISFDVFEIAQESYRRCISKDKTGNAFFKAFYSELLKISPQAASKFQGKDVGENDFSRQYTILREAIFMLLLFGKNKLGEDEPNILSRIAEVHGSGPGNYGISPGSYDAFVQSFLNTVCGQGSDISPFDIQCTISRQEREIIKDAWFEALKPGIEYMKRKA